MLVPDERKFLQFIFRCLFLQIIFKLLFYWSSSFLMDSRSNNDNWTEAPFYAFNLNNCSEQLTQIARPLLFITCWSFIVMELLVYLSSWRCWIFLSYLWWRCVSYLMVRGSWPRESWRSSVMVYICCCVMNWQTFNLLKEKIQNCLHFTTTTL